MSKVLITRSVLKKKGAAPVHAVKIVIPCDDEAQANGLTRKLDRIGDFVIRKLLAEAQAPGATEAALVLAAQSAWVRLGGAIEGLQSVYQWLACRADTAEGRAAVGPDTLPVVVVLNRISKALAGADSPIVARMAAAACEAFRGETTEGRTQAAQALAALVDEYLGA